MPVTIKRRGQAVIVSPTVTRAIQNKSTSSDETKERSQGYEGAQLPR